MGKSSLDYFAIWMTVIGTLLSVIGTLVSLDIWSKHSGVFLLITFLAIFGLLMLYFLNRWNKYQRYYQAYPLINRAFSHANSIANPDVPQAESLEKDMVTIQAFCTYISESFSTITNTQCRVCIKLLKGQKGDNRAWVETFVRDYNSALDQPDEKNEVKKHELIWNTDFFYIFDPQKNQQLAHKFYVNNRMPIAVNYRNSRLPKWWYHPEDSTTYQEDKDFPAPAFIKTLYWFRNFPLTGNLANRYFWPLKYRSGIVVPIVPLGISNLKDTPLQGYLCVDSNRSNAFDEKMDVQILMGIADGLDPTMRIIAKRWLSESEDTA